MGILSKLGIGPKEAADAVGSVVDKAADTVERFKGSDRQDHAQQRENFGDAAKATDDARKYDPRTTGTQFISEVVNVSVDALNRLIRPGVAILLIGGTFGMWDLAVTTTDPIVLGWTESVVGFYFGVRAITQDLPRLLAALKSLRSAK
jgi:hypothetical protein